jgi:hypothetical protein
MSAVTANRSDPLSPHAPFLALMIPLFAPGLGVKDQPGPLARHGPTATSGVGQPSHSRLFREIVLAPGGSSEALVSRRA